MMWRGGSGREECRARGGGRQWRRTKKMRNECTPPSLKSARAAKCNKKRFVSTGFNFCLHQRVWISVFWCFQVRYFPDAFADLFVLECCLARKREEGGKSGRGEEREEKWLCPLSLCLSLPPYRALSLPLYPSFSIPISPSLSLPPYPPLSFFSSNCSSSSRALSLSVYSSNGASSSTSVVEAFTAALSRFA
jgi:hypothetical protein